MGKDYKIPNNIKIINRKYINTISGKRLKYTEEDYELFVYLHEIGHYFTLYNTDADIKDIREYCLRELSTEMDYSLLYIEYLANLWASEMFIYNRKKLLNVMNNKWDNGIIR